MFSFKKVILFSILTIIIVQAPGCKNLKKYGNMGEIAIYDDDGVWNESLVAMESMFNWMGYKVSKVSSNHINSNEVIFYKIFCMPDGDMEKMSSKINGSGRESIREFINNGGSFIGTGSGAIYASEIALINEVNSSFMTLGVFEGIASEPVEGLYNENFLSMVELEMNLNNHPITKLLPHSKMWMLYANGPSFQSLGSNTASTIATYVNSGLPAIVAFQYGQGRVFLSGVNPEFEEGNARDSVNFEQELFDPETEWGMMRNVVEWCLD